ncbi:MAG: HDOD domain-containing protein [Thermodesulfobacteriota bacterium]
MASGQMVVSRKRRHILEAILGSCVGVTLVDRQAGVGGLIHLLLPEPSGESAAFRPELYASTGMPLFIQALIQEGAQKDRLQACLAGGALVGRVSPLDLSLDLGGRTTDVARSILNQEKIKVNLSETGGYLGCNLRLNLTNLESQIESVAPRIPIRTADLPKPGPEDIEAAIERVRPIPQIALKIIRVVNQGQYNWGEIGQEVRQDQVIGARVLHLCNSAALGLMVNVDSIDRALVILGEESLLQVVVSAACHDFFWQSDEGYSLCRGGLYRHAVGTAILAEKIARRIKAVPPDLAYTAGLLHDLGKVTLDRFVRATSPHFYRRTDVEGDDLIELEKEILSVSHTEVGLKMAKKWRLSDALAEAIGFHHHPEMAVFNPPLCYLVFLADLLTTRYQAGQELEHFGSEKLAPALSRLGLKSAALPELVELIPPTLV